MRLWTLLKESLGPIDECLIAEAASPSRAEAAAHSKALRENLVGYATQNHGGEDPVYENPEPVVPPLEIFPGQTVPRKVLIKKTNGTHITVEKDRMADDGCPHAT